MYRRRIHREPMYCGEHKSSATLLVSTPRSESKASMCSAILSQKTSDFASDFALVFHPPTGGLILSLEKVAANRCISRGRPVIKATNHEQKRAVFFRPRCKQWSCPTCGQINAERAVALAAHGSSVLSKDQGHVLTFVTVTSHERLSAGATLRVLPSAWPKLRKRIARSADNPAWLLIPELHEDGRVHLHGIVAAQLETRWLKDNARACGFGYMADAQIVQNVYEVVSYTAGYMGKTLQNSNFAKGFHRYRTAQHWPHLPELPEPPGWNFTLVARDSVLDDEVNRLADANYIVAVFDHATAWDFVNSAV